MALLPTGITEAAPSLVQWSPLTHGGHGPRPPEDARDLGQYRTLDMPQTPLNINFSLEEGVPCSWAHRTPASPLLLWGAMRKSG